MGRGEVKGERVDSVEMLISFSPTFEIMIERMEMITKILRTGNTYIYVSIITIILDIITLRPGC